MGKRDLEKEKQLELAAIWGGEVDGGSRYPKRRGGSQRPATLLTAEADVPMDPDALSDVGSELSEASGRGHVSKKNKKSVKKASGEYRLHCFVEPGTEKNAVRTVFEAYDPKVELRTSQKGSLLNKTQFAVLTFRNKAMALHAVSVLDGTNQRDLLGVKKLKLSLMLTRQRSKVMRKVLNRKARAEMEAREMHETAEDLRFIQQFVREHAKSPKASALRL